MLSSPESRALQRAARHARDLVTTYERAIADINGRNFLRGRFLRRGFFDEFTGMRNVLASMGACAVTKPGKTGYVRVEDWNPIAQRPVARPMTGFGEPRRTVTQEFDDLRQIYDHVVTLLHEAMHVVMWEPLFTGQVLPTTRNWTAACNAFEGFCFFFADIWISSKIQAEYPDGQVIFRRRAASQSEFSPLSVFHALGIRDPEKILETYLSALATETSALSHPRKPKTLAKQLGARLYPISLTGAAANTKVLVHFERTGITSSFYERFCKRPNIPSLLPEGELELDLDAPHAFAMYMFRRGLAAIHARSPKDVARVRTRRLLQTRAYYAHQLSWIVGEGLVFSPAKWPRKALSTADADRWSGLLATYLDDLEELLRRLCDGVRSEEIERQLVRVDRRYDARVRAPLEAEDLWVSRRELIFPAMPLTIVDLDSASQFASPEATRQLYEFLARVVAARCPVDEQLALMAQFFEGGARERRARGTKLLTRSPIRDVWSVPLAAIDPLRNSFRELAFNYE